MCLRGVFNNGYSILISNRVDAVHVRRHAIEVYRDNSFGARCDCGFKLGRADGPTPRVDIYKNRLRAGVTDRPSSCYKSHRRRNHFISRPDIEAT